jgi:hypothetical protein
MGIKGFSKTFAPRIIKQNDLKKSTCVIDTSIFLYQSCLGMSSVKGLTDSAGNPTIHINVLIARILNFIKSNIKQIWVIDYYEPGYSSVDKEHELAKRRKRKTDSENKINELKQINEDADAESIDNDEFERKINLHEKVTFSVNSEIVNDCKFILDCFNITWCVAPKGIEAEHLAAALTKTNELDFRADFVYSTDVDALLYGAKKLVRNVKSKGKKILQMYELGDILLENNINQGDLQKIGIILGSDHSPKTPGIGPKTVLRKFRTIELTDEQKGALEVFKKPIDISAIKFNNYDDSETQDSAKINKLLDWLETKNFSRMRIKTQILKVRPSLNIL